MNQKFQQELKILQKKWWGIIAFGFILWWLSFTWLQTWWPFPYPWRWLLVSGSAFSYLLWIIRRSLPGNHRPGEEYLLPTLGLGNLLSILRGLILALFSGFLFSPWPDSGWKAWLPGLLYTLAILPDFVDGIAARLTNHVTKLGETLDISIDSLGVLSVSLLSVQYGQVPWWYLLVGFARYIFLLGIWLRRKLNLPVFDLPFSVRRRGYAALAMGLFLFILYPIFQPPGTYVAAAVFAYYILGGFLWDWFVTIGWLPSQPGEKYSNLESLVVRYIPLILRFLLLLRMITAIENVWLNQSLSFLFWAEIVITLCLFLGIAGRVMAIVAMVIIALNQLANPLEPVQLGWIFVYANLLFLGTGAFSLWPVEDRLIHYRLGDPK